MEPASGPTNETHQDLLPGLLNESTRLQLESGQLDRRRVLETLIRLAEESVRQAPADESAEGQLAARADELQRRPLESDIFDLMWTVHQARESKEAFYAVAASNVTPEQVVEAYREAGALRHSSSSQGGR